MNPASRRFWPAFPFRGAVEERMRLNRRASMVRVTIAAGAYPDGLQAESSMPFSSFMMPVGCTTQRSGGSERDESQRRS